MIHPRYARQLGIAGFGVEGQETLARARVFVLGAGGLGLPALVYLGAAGVGSISFIDLDRVEPTNLNRQFFYSEADAGKPKALVASDRLRTFNPEVAWRASHEPLSEELASREVAEADIVLDCADNDAARRMLAHAACHARKPMLHGAVAGFEASLALFDAPSGPCYGCLYPESAPGAPPPVLGAVAGMVGAMMASEAIRCLCRIGPDRRGQLLLADFERGSFDWIRLDKRSDCPICQAPIDS